MHEDEPLDVAGVVAASSVAELCWRASDGFPRVRGVVALVRDERPALAFLYADEDVAREVAASATVVLSFSESRSTSPVFRSVAFVGRPTLTEDPRGEVYLDELITQELRRYPPSRLFADSPMLCREHWWYLPRLVVDLEVHGVRRLAARADERDHLLVVGPDLSTAVAGITRDEGSELTLDLAGPPPEPGAAVLFGQDASFPDLEQWTQWRYVGTWDGERLAVTERPGRAGLGRPPTLLGRLRRERDLERRCVARIPLP